MTQRRKRPHTDTRTLKVGKKRKLESGIRKSEPGTGKSEPGIRKRREVRTINLEVSP